MWHSVLGAQAGSALAIHGGIGLICSALFVLAIYWVKESGDLSRGGTWRDSVEDTIFVVLGVPLGYVAGDEWLAFYLIAIINVAGVFVMWKELKKNGRR